MTRAGKGFWLTTSDYHTVNLTGTWKHIFLETGEVRELPPGSYVFQPGGEMHGDAFIGPEDCVIMLQQRLPPIFSRRSSRQTAEGDRPSGASPI